MRPLQIFASRDTFCVRWPAKRALHGRRRRRRSIVDADPIINARAPALYYSPHRGRYAEPISVGRGWAGAFYARLCVRAASDTVATMLRPWNVFTPGKLPLKPENVYARRASVESALTKAFQRGKVPVVFGEYGVGKTSTVRKFVQEIGDNKHLVNIESVAKKRFEDIVAALLESVGFEVQLTSTQTASSSATKQLSGGLGKWGLTIGGMRGQQTDSSSALTAAKAVTSPTDSRVLAVCEEHGLQLVIDELHKATDDFKEDLANFVKAFGNRSCDRFRIYLVGTANDVIELVQVDEAEGVNEFETARFMNLVS